MKKCSGQCGIEKEEIIDNFRWRQDRNKFDNECKLCRKEYDKK
jgi:hypothetical protein